MANETWHGTAGGYTNHKCRCDQCKSTWNAYCAERRRIRQASYVPSETSDHGTELEYVRGCRCGGCKAAHAEVRRSRYRSRKTPRPGSEFQPGSCEVCGTTGLVVWDHDHQTDLHRGWLCTNCNQGLGLFSDRVDLIQSAITYLEGVKNGARIG